MLALHCGSDFGHIYKLRPAFRDVGKGKEVLGQVSVRSVPLAN